MSAQTKHQGYREGRRDAADEVDNLPVNPTAYDLVAFIESCARPTGRDADYVAGYATGFAEQTKAELPKLLQGRLASGMAEEFRRLLAERRNR